MKNIRIGKKKHKDWEEKNKFFEKPEVKKAVETLKNLMR